MSTLSLEIDTPLKTNTKPFFDIWPPLETDSSSQVHPSFQTFKHQQPSRYAQQALDNFLLNPFLLRVRSRDYAPNVFQTFRHTVIWVHESLLPYGGFILPTRRLVRETGSLLEHVFVVPTTHSGLQKKPRQFDEMTRRYQLACA